MKTLRAIAIGTLLAVLALIPDALAQSSPNWTFGYVPTQAEWNSWFAKKQDWLGISPCLTTGCTFSGQISLPASSTISAGMNLGQGVAPTSPANGDVWMQSSGLFVRANGVTIGPLGTGGSNTVTIGGTSATSFGLTNLTMVAGSITAGSMAAQGAGAVAITGGTISGTALNMSGTTLTNLPSPTNPGDGASKAYVDSVAGAGINPLASVLLATAAILPNTPTYNNGTLGVGATLTAGSNSTLTTDGTVAALGNIILVKNQASAFQNGIYSVTQAGSVSLPWILTRVTYFDQAAEQKLNSVTTVTAGTSQAGSSWIMNPAVTTVGTDPQNWTLFSSAGITNIGGVTGPIAVGSGLLLTGSTLSATFTLGGVATAVTVGNGLTLSGGVLAFTAGAAATIKGNATASPGAVSDIDLTALTARGTPNATADLLLIRNSSTGTLQSIRPVDITAQCPVSTVTGNTTLTAAKCQTILVDATSGAITITLFAANSANNGDFVYVKKIDASANNVSVAAASGNIDGFPSVSTNARYGSFLVQPDSTQWWQQ